MRFVLWSFFVFLASFSQLLPLFETSFVIPQEYAFVPSLVLIALSIVLQIEAMTFLKLKGRLKNFAAENEKLKAADSIEREQLTAKLKQAENSLEETRKSAERAKSALLELKDKGGKLSSELENYKLALKDTESKLTGALLEQENKAPSHEEVITLLSLLQEKGRFLDFLMDDITAYPDEQVGAAGRIVHQGCRKILSEYFDVSPLISQAEGEKISLENEKQASIFKFIGPQGNGNYPNTGTLLHRGWKTNRVELPERFLKENNTDFNIIAPAKLEIH